MEDKPWTRHTRRRFDTKEIVLDTLKDFLEWLDEQPGDTKFYDGELCSTCLVGKYARDTRGRGDLAFDGTRIVQVDSGGFTVYGGYSQRVNADLRTFVGKFDEHLGIWGEYLLDGYQGPYDDVTVSKVKEFAEKG